MSGTTPTTPASDWSGGTLKEGFLLVGDEPGALAGPEVQGSLVRPRKVGQINHLCIPEFRVGFAVAVFVEKGNTMQSDIDQATARLNWACP